MFNVNDSIPMTIECRTLLTLLFFILLMAGCTFNTRGVPPNVRAIEAGMTRSGNFVGSAHTVFVASSPVFTVAGGASHIPGPLPGTYGKHETLTLRSRGDAPVISITTYGNECQVEPGLAQEFRSLLDSAFARLEPRRDWRKINLHIRFVPAGVGVQTKSYALHLGRRADLNLFFSCARQSAARDVFYGFLTATHEMSHVMFHLSGLDKQHGLEAGGRGDELLAEGGPACIYRQLDAEGDLLSLSSALSEQDYFANAWETFQEPEASRRQWCEHWISALQGQ